MRPRRIAAGLIVFAFLTLAFLTSCVSVPVPPFGDQRGELGNLQVSLSVKYIPLTNPELPGNDALAHAWSKFGEAKALKDK